MVRGREKTDKKKKKKIFLRAPCTKSERAIFEWIALRSNWYAMQIIKLRHDVNDVNDVNEHM